MITLTTHAAERELKNVLGWSEEALRARLQARAAELGMTLKDLLMKAGIDKSNFYRGPARRIDTLLKLAEACEWDLAQILGVAPAAPLAENLLLIAYLGAERLLEKLPREAQTREVFVEMQAKFYDLAGARQRRGKPLETTDLDEIAELLASAWRPALPTDSPGAPRRPLG